MDDKRAERHVEITGDGNVIGDGSRSRVIKAEGAGAIGQVTGDVIFQHFAESSASVARYIRLEAFRTLIRERTRHFVGRDYLFNAIDEKLHDPDFPSGYIVIRGEPGIGKTTLIAELVNRRGFVHHFNIAPQNIRYTRDFLTNVCAQLIVRYGLGYYNLPPGAEKNSGFLSQLLAEVAERESLRPVVVLIDALDEAERVGLAAGANALYLPPTLPDGVTFVVTARNRTDLRLLVDRREDIFMDEDDPGNIEDVHRYIYGFLDEHDTRMTTRIKEWGLDGEDAFVSALTEKSEGNFMYLVYVLPDILVGRLTADTIDNVHDLPRGLEAYYRYHWRLMRTQNEARFDELQEPVLCVLAAVREPVTIAQVQGWTGLSPRYINQVINEWREFLNVERSQRGQCLYRIYHASFQDFLQKEVGLVQYHERIAMTGLRKIPGFLNSEEEQ